MHIRNVEVFVCGSVSVCEWLANGNRVAAIHSPLLPHYDFIDTIEREHIRNFRAARQKKPASVPGFTALSLLIHGVWPTIDNMKCQWGKGY